MNLTLYFRLILMSIFQSEVTFDKKSYYFEIRRMAYDNQLFYCPRVFAKDGFNVSLQIRNTSYCSSENGYRKFGHTMESVEFGFPSEDDELLHEYSEGYPNDDDDEIKPFTAVGTVGSVPVSVLEELFAKHGGIDWEKTISVEAFNDLTDQESL